MPRIRRYDADGSWHHVMNRGVSQRVLFAQRDDFRFFLARVARLCHDGEIEIHAFALLGNHFHLLVRSRGELSRAIARLEIALTLWVNHRYERNGPLYTARFRSRRIDSDAYWHAVVRYIDHNPVLAGLADVPWEYPWGSAILYATREGPPWLTRRVVEKRVCEITGESAFSGALYARVFRSGLPREVAELVEQRTLSRVKSDPLHEVLRAPPEDVLVWMRAMAENADGQRAWIPMAPAAILESVLEARKETFGSLDLRRYRTSVDGWEVLRVGLLRVGAGMNLTQIARRCGCASSTAWRRARLHDDWVQHEGTYARLAVDVLDDALRKTYPGGVPEV